MVMIGDIPRKLLLGGNSPPAGLPLGRPVWDRVWIYGHVSEYADRICAAPNFPSSPPSLEFNMVPDDVVH